VVLNVAVRGDHAVRAAEGAVVGVLAAVLAAVLERARRARGLARAGRVARGPSREGSGGSAHVGLDDPLELHGHARELVRARVAVGGVGAAADLLLVVVVAATRRGLASSPEVALRCAE